MKCIKCGNELSDDVNVCPACGTYSVTETADKSEKSEYQFALDLKEKIANMIREGNNFAEANNYIDLYLSMIGMDAEIIKFQEEIKKRTNQPEQQFDATSPDRPDDGFPGEIEEQDPVSGLEIEINQVPEQSIESKEDLKPDDNEEIFLPEAKGDPLELDDEITFGDISDEKVEEIPSPEQENIQDPEKLELADNPEDDILVLGTEDEILDLDESMVESPEPDSLEKDELPKKDILSQIEIEINQEAEKSNKESAGLHNRQKEFQQDTLTIPDEARIPETMGESGGSKINLERDIHPSDPLESMLDDLKEKKRKVKRWLFITLAIGGFIALIITLYILSAGKNGSNQIVEPTPSSSQSTRKTPEFQKKLPDRNQSMQQKTFLDKLARARDFLSKNDIQNAEKMIGMAKKISTSESLTALEEELRKRKAEQKILKEIEIPEVQPDKPDTSEERAYNKAKSSSDPSFYKEYLSRYPHGKFAAEVRKGLKALKKQERKNFEQQLIRKLQMNQKITCRYYPQSLSDGEVKALLDKKIRIPHKVEIQTINGDRVIINFTTGLMWHQWRETMDFQKAKWWASREHGGYFDWRLPTAEEASTLSIKDIQNLIPGNTPDYELWTGDTDSRDSRNAWVYSPFRSNFTSIAEDQYRQLWSVRLIGKIKGKKQTQ
jgi:hypothetical protein